MKDLTHTRLMTFLGPVAGELRSCIASTWVAFRLNLFTLLGGLSEFSSFRGKAIFLVWEFLFYSWQGGWLWWEVVCVTFQRFRCWEARNSLFYFPQMNLSLCWSGPGVGPRHLHPLSRHPLFLECVPKMQLPALTIASFGKCAPLQLQNKHIFK